MNQYKKFLGRTDLVKNQVEREKLVEQEATSKKKRSIQEQNRQRFLKYQEQLRSELAARYFHSVMSTGGESFSNTKSLNFDGTDAYLEGATNYTLADGASKMTISCWVKFGLMSSTAYLASVRPSGGNRTFEIRTQGSGGSSSTFSLLFYVNNASNQNRFNKSIAGIRNDGLWHHLMICVDLSESTGDEVQFFIDKVAQNPAGRIQNTTFPSNPSPLLIGHGLGNDYFKGAVDEFAIWVGEDLRTQSKVDEIYGTGEATDLANLSTVSAPTTWFRMGDKATIVGDDITIPDQIGTYNLTSEAMVAADVQEDTPG